MRYEKREIGRSGICASPIAIGCWAFGGGSYWGAQAQGDVDAVVSAALERGYELFNTAEGYNDGASETSLGAALKGRRDRALISTKFAAAHAYPDELRASCEASLRRLGTDYIDIYMLHWPITAKTFSGAPADARVKVSPPRADEMFATLDALKREGKIRAYGVSNYGPEQLREAEALGADIQCNEIAYNIFSRAIERDILPYCAEKRISILTTMTIQQGLLAGKYARPEDVPPNQAHSRHFSAERGGSAQRHGGTGAEKEMFDALPKLYDIARELGVTPAQLAVAWCVQNDAVGAALVGCRNLRQLEENTGADGLVIPPEIMARIADISEPVLAKLGFSADYYESPENGRIF